MQYTSWECFCVVVLTNHTDYSRVSPQQTLPLNCTYTVRLYIVEYYRGISKSIERQTEPCTGSEKQIDFVPPKASYYINVSGDYGL